MKKICAIALVIAIFAAASCAASANYMGFYPKATIVTELDYENDLVIIEDFNGFLWSFEGIEDWIVNDICSLLMYDNGTSETIFDDIIVDVHYDGWVE